MGRRAAIVASGILFLALAGCGDSGGGGDEDAFCDSLDALSDQVADGDLASDDGLEDAVGTASDLLENASSDQEDAVTEVGETLEEADPDDAADTADLIEDELGDFAEDCDIDDFAQAPEEETTTTTEGDETTTTGGDETTTSGGGGGDPTGERNIVTAAIDPTTIGLEPGFEAIADECFRGLMVACDDLFFGENGQEAAPDGSAARLYSGQCGGRILQFVNDSQRCVENIFAAAELDVTQFEDPSFEGLATACHDTDMAACDQLFQQTGVGTFEEAYGRSCGGRIGQVADRNPGQTTCVDIFGAIAEFG